jgi:hypothetical protein
MLLGQGHVPVETKLHLGSLPQFADRCYPHIPLLVDWVDDQRLLVTFSVAPCHIKGSANYPHNKATVLLDLQGNVLASARRDSTHLVYFGHGPAGQILAMDEHLGSQILDAHFNPLKSIPCVEDKCSLFLASDDSGFALCRESDNKRCRYYRGENAEAASAADFPGAFPKLLGDAQESPHVGRPIYKVGNDETWSFDHLCHLISSRSDGLSSPIPGTIPKLVKDCSAEVAREAPHRLLADYRGGIVFGDELILYAYDRLTLYDVCSRTALATLDPGTTSSWYISPDGRRVAVSSAGDFSRSAEIRIYYVP